MAYMSTKCHGAANGPHGHEDCVTGPSVFNIGERELCTCPCYEAERLRIDAALAAGKTRQQLVAEWYADRNAASVNLRHRR